MHNTTQTASHICENGVGIRQGMLVVCSNRPAQLEFDNQLAVTSNLALLAKHCVGINRCHCRAVMLLACVLKLAQQSISFSQDEHLIDISNQCV